MKTIAKIRRKLRYILIAYSKNKSYFHTLYPSWWHMKISSMVKDGLETQSYMTAIPNPGAGIGHQLANWIAGLWFSKYFGLKYAHTKFTPDSWEHFLGFGEQLLHADYLIKNKGYKRVRLPMFDEDQPESLNLIRNIISSYSNKKIVFVLEQDQNYRDQFGVIDDIQNYFYSASSRCNDKLTYSESNFNIAIHIRRGDISVGQINHNENLLMRWQDLNYFKNILKTVIHNLTIEKPIKVYIFSQGNVQSFEEFSELSNVVYCINFDPQSSFLHMIFADILITSKSSFSYKPALISKGFKISPKIFWHGYPDDKNWITANENGSFDIENLIEIKK